MSTNNIPMSPAVGQDETQAPAGANTAAIPTGTTQWPATNHLPTIQELMDAMPPATFGEKRLHDVHKLELQVEANAELARAREAEERAAEMLLEKEKIRAGIITVVDDDCPWRGRELIGQTMDRIQLRAIDWLWTGWIPRKYITLIVGESGAGKSTVLADIVARITTGRPWPGEPAVATRRPGRVLWLGSEDGLEDMLGPRLEACGADRSRVVVVHGVAEGKKKRRSTFSMQDDIELICQWLDLAEKEGDPFVMLVIDPITSYLPGKKLRKVDMNDTGQMRSILEPWFEVAQKRNIAITSVTHFNKDNTRSMLHRVTGSAVFAQTCRSLCAMVDREDDGAFEKAMVQVKLNLPDHPGGAWKFRTVKVQVGIDPGNGKPVMATRPEWVELDGALTPQSFIGGERGPVGKDYSSIFCLWLKAFFLTTDPEQGLPVSVVREAAIAEKICSKKWWEVHSGKHLEKRNVGGTWMCRPAAQPVQNLG